MPFRLTLRKKILAGYGRVLSLLIAVPVPGDVNLNCLGDGRLLIWVGTGLLLSTLYGTPWICDRAVLRQRGKFREERRKAGSDGDHERWSAPHER